MIKMVVSSFYNTLIDYEEAIPMSTMLEIDKIRNNNILFTVLTNGLYKEILEYNKDFPFVDYIVSLNGSYVYSVLKNKCIYKQKISKLDVKKIYNSFKKYKIYYYTENKVLTNYNETLNNDIYKIEIEDIKEKIITNINCNLTVLEKNNKTYLEIISNKCNPYKGLNEVMLENNISNNEVISIIGNESDIDIFNNIKETYIVENSIKKVNLKNIKKTDSNNNKGVENILKCKIV